MKKILLGPIAALSLVAFAPLAKADIQISYKIDGGALVTCGPVVGPGASVLCANVSGPSFNITLLGASSNSPGGNPAEEESATVDLSNPNGVAHTIVINVASDNFTIPTAPPSIILDSHIGGTVLTAGAGNSLSYQSCVGANTLLGCPGAFNSGVSTPSIKAAGSFANDQFGTITSLSSPYAIDETLTITLSPGSNVNFSASTTLTPVPEPMSIALLGGVLFFTVSSIQRRRKQSRQA